uniref:Protein IQ-DOMAIN 31 n=1 Tax=Cajanus cajan TaxID=3821 RepID=A0A151UBG4_CAJCA|nr:Protein IQ-DOMAIN 31 [Cajanus cajan]
MLNEAAIIVQAAIRGYQARGTFKTLKGITTLQAYIRGQLVRRQAVSALYCVKSIVKFQALARAYKVRHSSIGLAVQKIFKDTKFPNSVVVTSTQASKLSDNIFVHKLLASTPSVDSPYLNYNAGEPNLAYEWLNRWTISQFWIPLPEAKKPDSMSNKINSSYLIIETNKGRIKRNARKAPSLRIGDDIVSDSNKHEGYPKKDSNLPLHSAKRHPQKELEKTGSKKSQIQHVPDKSEVAIEKKTHITKKVSYHIVNDVPREDAYASASSKKIVDLAVLKSKQSDIEKSLEQQAKEHDNETCNDTNAYLKRRASLPANFMDHENVLHNIPRALPSYMAPTESTKAKLRGQGSPQPASDLVDIDGVIRRLSSSSTLNEKLGPFSPPADRLAALSSKGIIKTDRSLSSSRNGTGKNLGFCTFFSLIFHLLMRQTFRFNCFYLSFQVIVNS